MDKVKEIFWVTLKWYLIILLTDIGVEILLHHKLHLGSVKLLFLPAIFFCPIGVFIGSKWKHPNVGGFVSLVVWLLFWFILIITVTPLMT